MSFAYLQHVRNLRTVASMIASGTEPTANIMAASLDMTPRQIHRYIATLRELGAPLPLKRGRIGYWFARPWSFDRAFVKWLRQRDLP